MGYQGEVLIRYMTNNFAKELQLIHILHGLYLILLCVTWSLLERQKQFVPAIALSFPTNLINLNGLQINYLSLTKTKHLISIQFIQHACALHDEALTSGQVDHCQLCLSPWPHLLVPQC